MIFNLNEDEIEFIKSCCNHNTIFPDKELVNSILDKLNIREKKYFCFTEENDWEGETWNFFFIDDKDGINKKAFSLIKEEIQNACEEGDFYSTNGSRTTPGYEVDILVENSSTSYMNENNKFDKLFSIEVIESLIDNNNLIEKLYKGGIVDLCLN